MVDNKKGLCYTKQVGVIDLEQRRNKTLDMCYIALFSALMAVCAWINIPSPTVHFTMQLFAIFTSTLILGGRRSTIAILVYLLLGAIGLPVFAGFTGGLGRILGSSGGFLIGYLAIPLLYWMFEKKVRPKNPLKLLVLSVGLFMDYSFGTAWFILVYTNNTGAIDLQTALVWCVTPFIIPDLFKLYLAFLVDKKIHSFVKS